MAAAAGMPPQRTAEFWRHALGTQRRVLSALFFRDADSRRGRRFFLGYVATGFEPLIVTWTIGMVFYTIGRGAPYGSSMILFLATGVFPVYLFIHTSMRLRQVLAPGSHRKRYPIETSLDHIVVHVALHLLSTILVGGLFFLGMYWWGIKEALPWDVLTVMGGLAIVFLFGIGMGIINSVVARLFPLWDALWPALARGGLHFSAPYFVAAWLPPHERDWFALNPIIHAVDYVRDGFYFFYPHQLTEPLYPLAIAVTMIALGLLLEASVRTYLEDKE